MARQIADELVQTGKIERGWLGLITASKEILDSVNDLEELYHIYGDEMQTTLAWIEHSAYLTALDRRYQALVRALELYLEEFEKAYTEACTCVEPFDG